MPRRTLRINDFAACVPTNWAAKKNHIAEVVIEPVSEDNFQLFTFLLETLPYMSLLITHSDMTQKCPQVLRENRKM